MGLIDNVRNFFWENLKDTTIGRFGPVERLIEPQTEEYQNYKRSKQAIVYDINRFNEYLQEDRTKDDKLRWEYALHEAERKLEFVRPNTAEDIEYRRRIGQEFASQLQETAGNLDLRFHGTPMHFAEEIIKSGSISSSADRWDGYNQSTDGHGVFSVSDIDSLPRTVNWFLNVDSHVQSQPCGCLFVLTPGNQTQEQRDQSIMDSVDLWNNPERLHSIVTTPENVERVQQWLTEMGMDPGKVHTFDDFVELAREEALELEQTSFERDNNLDISSEIDDVLNQTLSQEQTSEPVIINFETTIVQTFKETYNIPETTPLFVFEGHIVVEATIENEDGTETPGLIPLFEINEDNPRDMESGLNHEMMDTFFKDSMEQKIVPNENEPEMDDPEL